jgi:uncharacterized tellurite resistance protein B-like protein
MSDSLGLAVVSRIAPSDRLPFVKALAHLAAVDDEVTLDEKKAVMSFAEAWDMDDDEIGEARDILRSAAPSSMSDLVAEFSEPNTPFLLLQELVRLSLADGSYADVERREIRQLAAALGLSDRVLEEIETWVKRGSVWGLGGEDETGDDAPGPDSLAEILDRHDDEPEADYDLDDIPTATAEELRRLKEDEED